MSLADQSNVIWNVRNKNILGKVRGERSVANSIKCYDKIYDVSEFLVKTKKCYKV